MTSIHHALPSSPPISNPVFPGLPPSDGRAAVRKRPLRARARALALTAALALSTGAGAARAGAPPAGPSLLVVHGGDRTLAAIASPAGPVHPGLATLGTFPNEIVVRGSRAYVVESGSNRIAVIDLLTGSVLQTIPTGPGTNPYGLAFLDDTRMYVSRLVTNDVVAIDLPAGTIAATIPVGLSPEGVAVAEGRVFVANSGFDFGTFGYVGGTVSVIDPATETVTATLPVGLNPQALDLAPNGELHVVCTGNYFSVFGRAFVIDPATPAVVDSVELGGSPGTIAVRADGAAFLGDYVAGLLKYDTVTRTPLRDAGNPIAVGTGAGGIDFGDGLTWVGLYGDDAVVTLDATDAVTQTFPVGDGPQDVVFHVPTPPIPVALAAFTGTRDGSEARLEWRTTREAPAGFHVERAAGAAGPWERRTPRVIPPRPDGRYAFREPLDAGDDTPVWYRLTAVGRDGREEPLEALALRRTDTGSGGVTALQVGHPAPNPLRGDRATVAFRTTGAGRVRAFLFDAAGRPVRRLLDAALPAGEHDLVWDARDDNGVAVAPGVYFVRVTGGVDAVTRRLTVVARPGR